MKRGLSPQKQPSHCLLEGHCGILAIPKATILRKDENATTDLYQTCHPNAQRTTASTTGDSNMPKIIRL
jgi:hypothetical protein